MERIVNLRIEKLPEGVYLATSEDIPGLVAQGRTVTETLEIARDVAKKLLQAQSERQDQPTLQEAGDSFDYPLVLFPPNGFGLFDMSGNVWEWVEDCWHGSYEGAPRDGSAWTHGGDCGTRALRGGSWYSLPRNLRSANRNRNTTANRNDNNGFRVARTLDGPSRRPHGATGRTTERPGTVIMSEGPAPLLPRSGGEEAPVFVSAHGDHGERQSPGGTTRVKAKGREPEPAGERATGGIGSRLAGSVNSDPTTSRRGRASLPSLASRLLQHPPPRNG